MGCIYITKELEIGKNIKETINKILEDDEFVSQERTEILKEIFSNKDNVNLNVKTEQY